MSALSGSLRVAGRLTDYDRAAMLARRKMEEIIADKRTAAIRRLLEGAYDPGADQRLAFGLAGANRAL